MFSEGQLFCESVFGLARQGPQGDVYEISIEIDCAELPDFIGLSVRANFNACRHSFSSDRLTSGFPRWLRPAGP
jgi:hypothetical protein